MLQLGARVRLGVEVGDLLELLRRLEGHVVAAHPTDEERARCVGQRRGHRRDPGLGVQHGPDLLG